MAKYFIKLLTLTFFMLSASFLLSQDDDEKEYLNNYMISGATKKGFDTLAFENALKTTKEVEGLLEKEIDPAIYLLGPGDEFEIFITGVKFKKYNTKITPEGKISIPEVGIVDLKGKTLEQGSELIRQEIRKVFNTQGVYVSLSKLRKFKVLVSGHVGKPSAVSATAADRVSEVIEKAGGLKFQASIRNIMVIRDDGKQIKYADLLKFYMLGYKDKNPSVLGGDHIVVPPSNEENSISIYGDVSDPGDFEYVDGDSLSHLIKFAQGFERSAFLDSVEFARYDRKNGDIINLIFDLSTWKESLFTGNSLKNDMKLHSGDRVFIRKIPKWVENETIVIKGEVKFPGYYPVDGKTTRVADVIARAGGFTEKASLDASLLIRQSEIQKFDPEMDRLSRIPPSEMSENELRYYRAKINEQKGVMAIDFNNMVINYSSDDNIVLIDEDSLYIPPKKRFVNVQGRVNNPGLVIYDSTFTYLDYIDLAGGFGFRADENETLVVKKKGQFLAEDMNYIIEPGDYILVPPEEETSLWEIVTTVITFTSQILTIIAVLATLR